MWPDPAAACLYLCPGWYLTRGGQWDAARASRESADAPGRLA